MVGNRVKSRVAAVADASRSAVPALEAPVERRTSARIRSKADAAVASTPLVVAQKEVSPSLLDEAPPKKRRRKTKDDRPTVYDILPVQQLTTTYRGRLGYACLNTILRATKPDPIFCSRTCRIDTILKNGLDFAKNLGLQNANDLCKLIQWNEDNQIKFLRISSEMFPFASHATYGYDLDYASAELKVAGDLAKSLGHRMTLHPGQFTQLGSPKENVVEASIRELQYHCSILNLMGMGKDSVIIIHMGGMYGDKPATLARFKENYTTKLSDDIKARLVLENDEMCYNADDLLPLCEELDIPIVFDYHHNWIFPSADPLPTLLPRINAIWHRKGIRPKQHLSSPRPGATTLMERRAHAGRCATLPDALQDEGAGWWRAPSGEMMWVDLMIEAKDKEQAVLQLYRTYGLAPVIWENLRPEEADRKKDKDEGAAGSTTRRTRKAAAREDVDEVVTAALEEVDPAVEVESLATGDPIGGAAGKTKRKRKVTKNDLATEVGLSSEVQIDEIGEPTRNRTRKAVRKQAAPA